MIKFLTCRYGMLCTICIVHIRLRKPVPQVDNAGYTAPTLKQHELYRRTAQDPYLIWLIDLSYLPRVRNVRHYQLSTINWNLV